jgi:mRNA interferase MazF
MLRGEIWLISFPGAQGGEIKKTRPAIIVSNDASNEFRNRVQVIPLTSNTDRILPDEVLISSTKLKSKALASQITTASKERMVKKLGSVSQKELHKIEWAIRVQLDLRS